MKSKSVKLTVAIIVVIFLSITIGTITVFASTSHSGSVVGGTYQMNLTRTRASTGVGIADGYTGTATVSLAEWTMRNPTNGATTTLVGGTNSRSGPGSAYHFATVDRPTPPTGFTSHLAMRSRHTASGSQPATGNSTSHTMLLMD